jgi:hypothetical protein
VSADYLSSCLPVGQLWSSCGDGVAAGYLSSCLPVGQVLEQLRGRGQLVT